MSNINIKRVVASIRSNITVYTPIVEVIVNGLQAIADMGRKDGKITIRVNRSDQFTLDSGLPDVTGFEIGDNGTGFTDEKREAFDTFRSDFRLNEGGKGFGRFTCLRFFDNVRVESVYRDFDGFSRRTFTMGKDNNIIVDETDTKSFAANDSCTIVYLANLNKEIDKRLDTIARNLVEKLLPYFISSDYQCPAIILSEKDGDGKILLNGYVSNELSAVIQEIPVELNEFTIARLDIEWKFIVRVFRFYYPGSQKSKISLVACRREVSGSALHHYVPEFSEDFYDGKGNYIIKAYVSSPFQDQHVALERSGFDFPSSNDQNEIEAQAAEIASKAVGPEIAGRQEKKRTSVQKYVDSGSPWYKSLLPDLDLGRLPYNPLDQDIEHLLHSKQFAQEVKTKRDVYELLAPDSTFQENRAAEIVSKLSEAGKNELIRYVALRKHLLDILKKSLEITPDGIYRQEKVVHNIIFPRYGDSDTTRFDDHNLWIIDERLNFTEWISSDKSLQGGRTERVDILIYGQRVAFRGENESSNPVIIFEFKRPGEKDFINASKPEDPIEQIVRYVNDITDDKYMTPQGRTIEVTGSSTPFYGYVVCDLSKPVADWLQRVKNFTVMPDKQGWFTWMANINLYIEVISWNKVLRDATMRNKIFFHKLGIS